MQNLKNLKSRNTSWNATSILTAIGKPNIPVYAGAPQPLARQTLFHPSDIHGASGLDGTSLLPQPLTPANTSVGAVDAMAAAIMATGPGSAWIVATGGLTNVASLFRAHPEAARHVNGVSLMGGAIGGGFTDATIEKRAGGKKVERVGNSTRMAEFNMLIDPEAADEVFSNADLRGKITMVPLDVTHQVLATRAVRRLLHFGPEGAGVEKKGDGDQVAAKGKTTLRTMLVELLNFFAQKYKTVFGISDGPPLHDPVAVAAALKGTEWEIPFFETRSGGCARERYNVRVVTQGTLAEAMAGRAETGRTVATLMDDGQEGVRIPRGLDVGMFWKVLEDCVKRADEVNASRGVL